ncbi:GHKL domain-containing protein [bacterium]|nr:GHKL domain-containing protein [bacterium]
MKIKLEKIIKDLNNKSEINKSYRSYLRYIHKVLEDNLDFSDSVLIYRVGNYFIKSEFLSKNWFLSIDNIEDDTHYKSLKNISIKEIFGIYPNLRLLTRSYQQENDFNILINNNIHAQEIDFLSTFIFFMLDSMFSKFIQVQRAKEVICLYKIQSLALIPNISVEQFLEKVVKIIAATWTFNHYAQARITCCNHTVSTKNFVESILSMKTELLKGEQVVGFLEITYPQEILNQAEYPFLQVEKKLIADIAKELSGIIEDKFSGDTYNQYFRQLRHTDRLATLGQLTSGIATQLNEPLNDILGFSELLSTNDSLDSDAKNDLAKIINASLSARDIVKKLMHFSGEVASKLELVDINENIKSALLLLQARSHRKDINIKLYLHAEMPSILIDPSQFHQILVNILLNAEQAIKCKNGIIEITTEVNESSAILNISDNGEGIDPAVKDKIFIPLFSTKKENMGTGIGLSVAKDLIEANGGSISFQSSPGNGTLFTLIFPIHRGVSNE